MAKIIRVNSRHPRRKKFEHFKLKARIYLFRASVTMNGIVLVYLADQTGYLTNIYEKVAPILESLLTKLPL